MFSDKDKISNNNFNDIFQKIVNENDNLRECIFLIHNELGEMLE